MAATTYSYLISTGTANGKVASGALALEISQSSIVTALDYIGVDVSADNVDVAMKDALSGTDEETLDGLLSAHTGVPLADPTTADGVPVVKIDGPSDPRDKKPVVVISPATEGYKTWLCGRGDDLGPPVVRGGGDQFRLDFIAANVPETKVAEFGFAEPVEIHDGQVQWSPKADWGADDEFSLGVRIPATVVTPNGSTAGNCNVVDTGQGYSVIIPAAGDGTHDVDLATACPVPAEGAGYWDNDYDTAVVSVPVIPGVADWHLLNVDVTSWLLRNVSMTHEGGWFDIDVYKTEYFHSRWKLLWQVTKNSAGDGTVTGWILTFRKNTS